MKPLSQIVHNIPASGIRRFFDLVAELDDVISLAALPDAARQEFAALTVLHQAAHYGHLVPETSQAELTACLERFKRALRQPKS